MSATIWGQMQTYTHLSPLNGINNKWHKIILPNAIYSKISSDCSDIRIYGITSKKDTIEVPYLLQLTENKTQRVEKKFRLINQTSNKMGYYFTFESPEISEINEIKLAIQQPNFDWKLDVEGSNNQNEWFTIAKDNRIISLKNDHANYQFTNINFQNSKYQYYRILIKTALKPLLTKATLSINNSLAGNYRKQEIKNFSVKEDKNNKTTIINAHLNELSHICQLKINVSNKEDYYRPLTVEYLIDSIKTPKGWIFNYSNLVSGSLNSVENNDLKFDNTLVKKLRISIENKDNEPLKISSLEALGSTHEILVRFTQPANYYIVYGKRNDNFPQYDIGQFKEKIPVQLTPLSLGAAQKNKQEKASETEPLFVNKNLLWLIMVLIIALLGWFTLMMIKNK